jgi:hypothetical protein
MATKNIESFPGRVEVTSNLTVNTNTLHVDSVSGRVGIGKTNPGHVMDVNGIVNSTGLYVNGSEFTGGGGGDLWTASGSDIYSTGGNVGIGVTNPAKKLHVTGTVKMTNSYGDIDMSAGNEEFNHQAEIYAQSGIGQERAEFGSGVAISSDASYALIGARRDDGPYSSPLGDCGSVYVFTRSGSSTWNQQTKFQAPDAAAQDYFGRAVAMSSDASYAIVGAYGADDTNQSSGAVYMFARTVGSTWSYQAKFTSPNPSVNGNLGIVVGISGDGSYAIASAYRELTSAGRVYIYARSGSTWTLQQTIAHPAPASYQGFGRGVAISTDGSYAAIGSAYENGYRGRVYIYTRSVSNWTEQTNFDVPGSAPGTRFGGGCALSSDGSYLAVGAYGYSSYKGAVTMFARTGTNWSQQAFFSDPSANPHEFFGREAICMSGDGSYVFVGNYRDNDYGSQSGAVYVYNRSGSTWSQISKFYNPTTAAAYDKFGKAVSITPDATRLLSSAIADGIIYYQSGKAFIVTRDPAPLEVSKPIIANGTTLSFTGQHICFPEGPMEQGLVVSANKNKYVNLNGPLTTDNRAIRSSESLPVVSLSNVANDGTVFGVVDHLEMSGTTRTQENGVTITRQDKEMGDNRVVVNSLGEGAIWVANTNGNVASGDLLTTSHLPGYAQKQNDNIFRNRTVAKSTMDCDFDPQELPNQVILKDVDGNNVLDSYGRLQWVDDPEGVTRPNYNIRYLDVSGTPTDKANAVHTAAFVGCTYHCG